MVESRGVSGLDKGFSLLELMSALAIIAILLLVAVGSYYTTTSRAAEVTCQSNRRTLNSAVQMFRADNQGQPIAQVEDLVPYATDLDSAKTCPVDDDIHLMFDSTSGLIVCPYHQN